MKALKNKLALCLAAALGLAVALAACSNSSDNGALLMLLSSGSGSTATPEPGDYKKTGTVTVNGKAFDKVTFGMWPQSLKADSVTVNESVSKTVGDYTYYKGSDGEWYAKKDSKYYKVEPIEWRVLTSDFDHDATPSTAGVKLLFSTKALVTQVWYDGDTGDADTNNRNTDGHEDIKPCNYKYSRARAYLNGLSYTKKNTTQSQVNDFVDKGFLNTAFTGAQKDLIATTTVDNSVASANGATDAGNRIKPLNPDDADDRKAVCDNTQDKIFLLSQKEVTTEAYGFNPSSSAKDSTRKFNTVDFAKDGDSSEVAKWWLRSPATEETGTKWITVGHYLSIGDVYNSAAGGCDATDYYVIPALCLKAGN